MSSNFKFKLPDGTETSCNQWVDAWSREYDSGKYPDKVYDYLVNKAGQMSGRDICILGAWKDGALKKGCDREFGPDAVDDKLFSRKWSSAAAGAAYEVWNRAAQGLGGQMANGFPSDTGTFLTDWSVSRGKCGARIKRFGLARASTLLHFISGGRYPIFDSRVRLALKKLTGEKAIKTVEWYLNRFCGLFRELQTECGVQSDPRKLDKALFAYGGKD